MIHSFADKNTELLWTKERIRPYGPVGRVALRKLIELNGAERLADLRMPFGNRLEALKGNRAGQYSIRINDQWRIRFRWEDGRVVEVEVVDYH